MGVAAEGFQGTTVLASDVWIPITTAGDVMPRGASLLTSRASLWILMGGRLKPGVALRRAQAEVESIGAALEREFPSDNRGLGLRAASPSPIPGNSGPIAAFLAILMAIAGLVLAIACVNLSGILVARAAARRREISVRIAIGAGRGRLIRQLLTETLLLFALGAAAGVAAARAMTQALVALLPAVPVPVVLSLTLDSRVLLFAVAVSAAAAVLCGLAPAMHAVKSDVVSGLKAGAAATDRLRLRNAFVVAQVALTVVLTVGAALFVRALQHAAAVDPGFDPRGVEVATLDLSLAGYTDTTGPQFAETMVQRVRVIPGIADAALSAVLPLGLDGLGLGDLTLPGNAVSPQHASMDADWDVVSPRYFSTLRLPLVAGRDFDEHDRAAAPRVAIVNETAARRFWPAGDPIGKVLLQWEGRPGEHARSHPLTIVGVARDARYRTLNEDQRAFIYVPMSQQYLSRTSILARTSGGRRTADVRALLATLDSNLPIVVEQTLEEHAAIGLVPQRLAAAVSGNLGAVALLLAAIGVYGVAAYAVAARTREIGIRLALGATRSSVVGLVLKQGMAVAAGGVVLGIVAAAAAAQVVSSLLFGVGPLDAPAFAAAAALLCAVAAAASYLPARHAANVPATEALRAE